MLNMGLVEDTPTGRLIFNVMQAFAEFERDMIVERTQESTRKAGFRLRGGPAKSLQQPANRTCGKAERKT